ncbi:MAG: chromosomal replication initiator protein DnaA [Candidatus Shapirobacteria bacterium]|nr:chromosomal replication initiator protein DnaA [Candidatus Shapirobacteria bacterium]MDD5481797.1 chromosomal replication initiator protein DnaA [Candidatus Shapirobacteria bacterium]
MDLNRLWQNVQEELKISVSQTTYRGMLAQTTLQDFKKNIATVGCPNSYLRDLIETRYYSLIKEVLDHQTKEKNSLVFTIDSQTTSKKNNSLGPLFKKPTAKNQDKKPNPEFGLLPNYNFDTFVVGSSNNFAHAAAQAIVKNPGQTYNPFFVWGGVGVGKTHLTHAIGNAIAQNNKNFKVLYVSAETFTNELVEALQKKTITKFKDKYRKCDCLLVDDIQFIAGKEYSQEEFFHTFNALYLSGRQVVLTSDRKPEEIPKVEDRLISRFMGGLTVDIQPPDYEMRLAILKQKAQEKNFSLPEEAAAFLAEAVESNIRELEGALFRLIIKAQSNNVPIDLEFTQNLFGSLKRKIKKTTPKTVLSQTAKHFSFKTKDLCGKSRKSELVTARHVAIYLLRKDLDLPLMKIGELIGGRDHTSIMYAIEKIEREYSNNQGLRSDINKIRNNFQS